MYFGGSFFDGLKVASTMQEFDINIIFKLASSVALVDLGKDERKPNFANLRMSSWFGFSRSDQAVSVQRPSDGYFFLSPTNLFSLLHEAAEAAIAILEGTIHIDGKIYRQGISLHLLYDKFSSAGSRNIKLEFHLQFELNVKKPNSSAALTW